MEIFPRTVSTRVMKRHYFFAIGLGIFFVMLTSLQLILTADMRHDRQIESDLAAIEESLGLGYFYVPDDADWSANPSLDAELQGVPLSELDLDENLMIRAEKNMYELNYQEDNVELCAVFRTDTTGWVDKEESEYSFRYHDSGRHCFIRSFQLL